MFPDRKFRTLASAMTEFCGSPHAGAHTSMGDVLATMQLLQKLAPALLRVLAGMVCVLQVEKVQHVFNMQQFATKEVLQQPGPGGGR